MLCHIPFSSLLSWQTEGYIEGLYLQAYNFLRMWSHLLKKSLMENFIYWCSWVIDRGNTIANFNKKIIESLKEILEPFSL